MVLRLFVLYLPRGIYSEDRGTNAEAKIFALKSSSLSNAVLKALSIISHDISLSFLCMPLSNPLVSMMFILEAKITTALQFLIFLNIIGGCLILAIPVMDSFLCLL